MMFTIICESYVVSAALFISSVSHLFIRSILSSREPAGLDRDCRDSVWEADRQYVLRCMYSTRPGVALMCACVPGDEMGRCRYGSSPHTHAYTHTHTFANRMCCVAAGWPRNKTGKQSFDHKTLNPSKATSDLSSNEDLAYGGTVLYHVVLHNKHTVTHFLFLLCASQLESPRSSCRGWDEGGGWCCKKHKQDVACHIRAASSKLHI